MNVDNYLYVGNAIIPSILPVPHVAASAQYCLLPADMQVCCMQVFLGRSDMAVCALACAYACTTPHQWLALLAILQAGTASLQEQHDPEDGQQNLADQLHEVLLMRLVYCVLSCQML